MRTVRGLLLLFLAVALGACGDDDVAIDSGPPEAVTTTTSTTEPDNDDDNDDDDGDNGDGGDNGDDNGGDEATQHSCDDGGRDVEISSASLTVELTGDCDEVLVSGNGNVVTIESTEELVVEGNGNRIEVTEAVDRITAGGAGNDIRYVGEPRIDDEACSGCDVEPSDG